MSKVNKEEFAKSLGRLEALSKGNDSINKNQLYHTPSDSDPGTWAGSGQEKQDSMTDSFDDNGTDYNGVKKSLANKVAMSKALTPAEVAIVKGINPLGIIGQKVSKGQQLTKAEQWCLKGGYGIVSQFAKSTALPSKNLPEPGSQHGHANAADTNTVKEEDVEAEVSPGGKIGKSFAGAVNASNEIQKGFEVSSVLYEFANAIGHALEGSEARIANTLVKSLNNVLTRVANMEQVVASFSGEQGEFNKSFAEAVVGIGQHLAGTAEAAQAQASQPVGPPRSQLRQAPLNGAPGVQTIQKGMGGLDVGEGALAKSQIVDAMCELVKGQKLNPMEVYKFESTGELSPQTHQAVVNFVGNGGGRS